MSPYNYLCKCYVSMASKHVNIEDDLFAHFQETVSNDYEGSWSNFINDILRERYKNE